MRRGRETYFCEDCNDIHNVPPQPKPTPQRGWKVVENTEGGGTLLNPRSGESVEMVGKKVERFILRSGPNKGQPIFRTELTVRRG